MQVSRFRRTAAALLVGGVAVGSTFLVPGPAPAAAGVTPAAASSAAPKHEPLDIVVLGDSYSAGNGATDDQGQPDYYGPENCYRSRVGWAEKYAAALRRQGRTVRLDNHACSGGKAPDIISPRTMDTASDSTPTPDGVSTLAQADAYLAEADLCNTKDFPDEEFWTYEATAVDSSMIDYDCTRMLRPQARFVTPDTDLVLFTMGGNDAGFTNIVTQCFILKSGTDCKSAIDGARAKLPEIKQLLLDDVAGLRAAGLRDDAKIVQLGYPYLQTDNGYTALGVPPYAAGDAVRSLIDDGTSALAGLPAAANVGHPGQMTFVPGVKEIFAGHEPDVTTPVGNPDRWVNQVGDGTNTSFWYHPNGLGQTAYAVVVARGGDYGATPPSPTDPVTARLRARPVEPRVDAGAVVEISTRVVNSDRSRPRGTLVARTHQRRATARVASDGRTLLRLRDLRPGRHRITVTYTSRVQHPKRVVTHVVVRRR